MCHNTSKPSIERTNFFFTIGEALHAIVGDQECVFDADRAHSGNDELGFESEYHTGFEHVAGTWGKHGLLIDFDAHTVTDESGFLTMSHKIVFDLPVTGYRQGFVVKLRRSDSRSRHRHDGPFDFERDGMCMTGFFGYLPQGVDPGKVGHITGEITIHIDHDRLTGMYGRTVAAYGQRIVEASASHGKIVGGGGVGIFACQDIAHEYLHAPPENAEYAPGV